MWRNSISKLTVELDEHNIKSSLLTHFVFALPKFMNKEQKVGKM